MVVADVGGVMVVVVVVIVVADVCLLDSMSLFDQCCDC